MVDATHPDDPRRDLDRVKKRLEDTEVQPPNVVVIHPTDRCNHSCDWCWYDRSREQIADDLIDRVIDNSIVSPSSVEEVIIAGGGEPLLHPSIERLILSIRRISPRAMLKVDTNGSLLRRLSPGVLQQISYLRVSLDATNAEEYAATRHVRRDEWSKVLDNIAWARRAAPKLQLGVSLVEHRRRALGEIEELVKRLEGLGVDWVFRKPLLSKDLHQDLLTGIDLSHSAMHTRVGGELNPKIPLQPPVVASALVLIGADAGIYPCYHRQGDAGALLGTLGQAHPAATASIREIWSAHAASVHPCRVHNAWQEFHGHVERPMP